MSPRKAAKHKSAGELAEGFLLRLSEGRSVDGLWIGTLHTQDSDNLLRQVEAALRTIRDYDARRYNRVRRDLQRVWVKVQPGGNTGLYNPDLKACELDPRLLLREGVTPSDIASVIVHEATHARLQRFGFPESLRNRIESLCRRQEHAFSERLPLAEGQKIRDKLKRMEEVPEGFWSDAVSRKRRKARGHEVFVYMGVPRWLVPLVRLVSWPLSIIVRLLSGLTRA